jgi:Flp pilus assembly protein protease CpaA
VPPRAFFPDPVTAGAFVGLLLLGLAVAAYVDSRTFRIPKWITLTLLGLGLVVNTARGLWLGSQGKPVWMLDGDSAAAGAADGFLFALTGALFAFALYFGMYALGTVKGGDVKLCTAIGAWLGGYNMLLFLFASVAVLFVWAVVWAVSGGMGPQRAVKRLQKIRGQAGVTDAEARKFAGRGLSFSLPAAVAAALVMMWAFRHDLQLVPPKADRPNGSAHAPVHTA